MGLMIRSRALAARRRSRRSAGRLRAWLFGVLPILAIVLIAPSARAFTPPPIAGYITDVAHHLDPETLAALSAQLHQIDETTGRQIAFLVLDSLDGEPLEDVGYTTAKAWRAGRAGKDDGVLVVLVLVDRKIRIEVGKGVEDLLPDLKCSDIIRTAIAPALRRDDLADAIRHGASAVSDALGADAPGRRGSGHQLSSAFVFSALGVGAAFFAWLGFLLWRARQKQWADALAGQGSEGDSGTPMFRSVFSQWAQNLRASPRSTRSSDSSTDSYSFGGSSSDSSLAGDSSSSGDSSSDDYSGGGGDFGGGGASGDF
jgi:uncharacterized protein